LLQPVCRGRDGRRDGGTKKWQELELVPPLLLLVVVLVLVLLVLQQALA